MKILHSAGIGDLIYYESYLPPGAKTSLSKIYWCSRSNQIGIDLFKSSKTFANVEHEIVGTDIKDAPEHLLELSTDSLFTRIHFLLFHGSTFLTETLADLGRFHLPEWFVLIQPSTPFAPPGQRKARDLDNRDWQEITRLLDVDQVHAVVVNSQSGDDPPEHERIINLTGQTTFPESIEILKRASGYWGIDSCLAILAAQHFHDPDNLLIRTRNPWVVRDARYLYAPYTSFPFLRPNLDANPHPVLPSLASNEYQVNVRLTGHCVYQDRNYVPNDVITVNPETAEYWIENGHAEIWDYSDTLLDYFRISNN